MKCFVRAMGSGTLKQFRLHCRINRRASRSLHRQSPTLLTIAWGLFSLAQSQKLDETLRTAWHLGSNSSKAYTLGLTGSDLCPRSPTMGRHPPVKPLSQSTPASWRKSEAWRVITIALGEHPSLRYAGIHRTNSGTPHRHRAYTLIGWPAPIQGNDLAVCT